jgi:hypothetical protein
MLGTGLKQKASCKLRYRRLLSQYLDGELSTAATLAVTAHLESCEGCRADWEQLQSTRQVLLKFEVPPSRGYFTGALGLSQPLTSNFYLKRFWTLKVSIPVPLAAGLLCAALGALLAIFYVEESQHPAPTAISHTVDTKIVEVPFERVVTRTVYVKPRRARSDGSRLRQDVERNVPRVGSKTLATVPAGDGLTNSLPNDNHSDFRPAASANLRVIKELN